MPEKQEQSRPVRRLSKTLGLGVKELPSNAAWLVSKAGHKGRSHVPAAASTVTHGLADAARHAGVAVVDALPVGGDSIELRMQRARAAVAEAQEAEEAAVRESIEAEQQAQEAERVAQRCRDYVRDVENEQRESVNLAMQVAVTVGVLVTLVVSADAISGERERGTLEALLLTPVSRRAIVGGKLVGALTLWFGAFAVSAPYVWVLGHGVSLVAEALLLGLVVGTLLAFALAALGLLISSVSNSNKISLSVSLFLLLALFAPTQLPASPQGWFGDVLVRVNPVGAAVHYLTTVLVDGQDWTSNLSYLVSPVLLAALTGGALVAAGSRMVRLHPGVRR